MSGRLRPSPNDAPRRYGCGVWSVVAIALGILVFPRDAHAYLDTGTASMVLQMLVASAAAGMVFFRQYRAKLKAFLDRRFRVPEEESEREER